MHQIQFRLEMRSRLRWGSSQHSQTPKYFQKEERVKGGKEQSGEERGEGAVREKKEEREGKEKKEKKRMRRPSEFAPPFLPRKIF